MKSVSRATKASSIFRLNGGFVNCSRLRTNTLHLTHKRDGGAHGVLVRSVGRQEAPHEFRRAGEKRHGARTDEVRQYLAGTNVLPSKDRSSLNVRFGLVADIIPVMELVRFVPIADITEAVAGAGQDRRGACWCDEAQDLAGTAAIDHPPNCLLLRQPQRQ